MISFLSKRTDEDVDRRGGKTVSLKKDRDGLCWLNQCWKWPVARSPNATKNHSGRPHVVGNTCICRLKNYFWATNSESMNAL